MKRLDKAILFLVKGIIINTVIGWFSVIFAFVGMGVIKADFPIGFWQLMFMALFAGIPIWIAFGLYQLSIKDFGNP